MKDYQEEVERVAEGVASRLDGRTVSSHEQFRQMVKEEIVEALHTHTLVVLEGFQRGIVDSRGVIIETDPNAILTHIDNMKKEIISTLTNEKV